MTTTTTAWPSSDLAGDWELASPLPVDGDGYTEPGILAVDTAGYQGGDSSAPATNSAVLALPEIEGLATDSGQIEFVAKAEYAFATFAESIVTGTSIQVPLPTVGINGSPFVLQEDDFIIVNVFSQSAVASDPGAPSSCTHSTLTFASAYPIFFSVDWRPRPSAFYAFASGGEAGNVTISWGASNAYHAVLKVFRGVSTSVPFDGFTPAGAQSFTFPNPPAATVTTDGSWVVVDVMGDAPSSGYATPVVSSGYTELVNTAKSRPNTRRPMVSSALADCSPGSYDPAAYTGLDWGNTAAVTYVLRPAPTVAVPVLVAVGVGDETATVALSDGDVALTAGNEIQILTNFLVGSGTRTLTFSGQTTGSISYNATAAQVQTALEALSNIAPGDVICIGGPLNVSPVAIEFAATYAQTDVAAITVSSSNTTPVNEIQALQSDRTGGTFVLSFGAQLTDALPWNATPAQVQAALAALSTIGLNNVECSGEPLPGGSILIEFTGTKGGANQATISVTDSGTGGSAGVSVTEITAGVAGAGMVISVEQVGSAGENFTLVDSYNIPRGGAYEPQMHVFELIATSYTPGQKVDVTVSDHAGNHSWTAALLVLDRVDVAGVIEASGTETGSTAGNTASWGSITPVTSGAKILAIMAKAKAGSQYAGVPTAGSSPAGYALEAEALADGMTMGVWLSPPVAAAATSPGSVSWSGTEAWATALLALAPIVGSSAGSDLYAVLSDADETNWVDLAPAAGSMFEVLEVDLSGIPADAVLTAARVELAHASSVPNLLRVALVGINPDDSIEMASEQQVGYAPGSTTTVLSTGWWTELSDGSSINDFSRLGVALISSSRHPALSNHRVFWVRVNVQYEEGGPVVSGVVGPTSPGSAITWSYSSSGGYPQNYYEVMVIQGSAQDPDAATAPPDPLNPSTGQVVYASGRAPGNLVRSVTLASAPLGRGTCTLAVRAWSQVTSSLLVASDWATVDFDITGTPATTPDQAGNAATYNPTSGLVTVSATAPAAVSRAWLERSIDAGSTWKLCEGGPFAVTASASNNLVDAYTPGNEAVLYKVSFDAGPMSETSVPDQVGSAATSTLPENWVFIVPSDPSSSMRVEVATYSATQPFEGVSANEPGGALVAVSEPLGKIMEFTVRTRSAAEREALESILDSGVLIRVVNILGESWLMRKPGDRQRDLQRWNPGSQVTAIRDGYLHSFTLVEVAQ